MKRTLLILAVIAVAGTACKKSEVVKPTPIQPAKLMPSLGGVSGNALTD